MKFEEIQQKIGGFGRFQKIQFGLIIVPIMFIGMNQLDMFFQVSTPKHKCNLSNSTVAFLQQSANYTSDEDMESVALATGSSCRRRVLNLTDSCLTVKNSSSASTTVTEYSCEPLGVESCLDGWRFGEEFGSTIVTEFKLVCEQSFVATLVKSLSHIGPLIGGIAFGQLSDKVGRKIAFIVGTVLMLSTSVAISFSVDVYMFTAILFVRTLVLKGLVVVTLCLTVECVDRKYRNSLAYLRNVLRPVSQILIAAMAYLLRDWRLLTAYAAAPQALIIVTFFFISESPMWLASKGKLAQLRQYATRANKCNAGSATEADILSLETEEPKTKRNSGWSCKSCLQTSALELIGTWPRARFIAANFLMLTVSGLANSAILFNAERLSGNFYVNFGLLGVSNAGSYLLGFSLSDRLGIVRLIRMDLVLGIIAMATVAAVPADSSYGLVATVSTQIGKVFLLNANNSVQIYGTQVFPTVARNLASGIVGVAISVGSLLAPFLLYAGESTGLRFLPFMVVSGLLVFALILTMLLPSVPERLLVTFVDFDAYLNDNRAGFTSCKACGARVEPINGEKESKDLKKI